MRNLCEIRAMLWGMTWAVFMPGVVLLVLATPALAEEKGAEVAPAVQAVPMTKLLHRVQETFPGRILKVELDKGGGTDENPPVYEVKVLMSDGNVLKLYYDARTLRLESILGRYQSGHGSLDDPARDGGSRSDGGRSGGGGTADDDGAGHDDGDDHDSSDHESGDGSDDD